MRGSDVTAFSQEIVSESATGRLRWVRGRPMESALQQEIQRIAYENCKPERVSYVWRDVPTVDEPKNPNPERETG